jgi:uracil-DNA glycosylase
MQRPVDVVIGFLEAEQARGVAHVFLDEDARDSLRELYLRASRGTSSLIDSASTAKSSSSRSPSPSPTTAYTESISDSDVSSRAADRPSVPLAEPRLQPTTGSKSERLADLRRQASSWQPALALGTLRETMVFASGNPDARLMLIGEAPGHEEERRGEPFVGPAGRKLEDILLAMGIPRDEVYISNIVKFRPATARQTTNNRKPSPEEIAACLPFVREEVAIVQPQCIIALGGTAAEGLLGLSGAVGAMRGSWHRFEGIPVRVTYHPSYLLQSGASNSVKRQVWEDMLAVMEILAMPVSEKQRGYFLPKP